MKNPVSRVMCAFSKHAAPLLAAASIVFHPVSAASQGKILGPSAAGIYETIYPDIGKPGSKGHKLGLPVYACIVDGIDISSSVSERRFALQRDALVDSLTSNDFKDALKQIPHQRIGLHLNYFGSDVRTVFNDQEWIVIDETSRFEVAKKLSALKKPYSLYTRTNLFVRHALDKLQDCKATDEKGRFSGVNAIDIMTDGTPNHPGCRPVYKCAAEIPTTIQHRNEAIRRGVTTNVMAMVLANTALGNYDYNGSEHLPEWAIQQMITPGAATQIKLELIAPQQEAVRPGQLFVLTPTDDDDPSKWKAEFNRMKKIKLILEMASGPLRQKFARTLGLAPGFESEPTVFANSKNWTLQGSRTVTLPPASLRFNTKVSALTTW